MQILSVKLGVATGLNMAQQCMYVLACLWGPESIAAPHNGLGTAIVSYLTWKTSFPVSW